MADNVNITEGSGKVIAADDISSVLYQRVKVVIGVDGTNSGDVSASNPIPITGSTTIIGTVAVSGNTTLVGTVTITGNTTILGTVTITGSTAVVGTVTVTGSTAIVGTVTVTGSTAVVNTVTVTGSTTVVSCATHAVTQSGTWTITGTTTGVIPADFGRSFLSSSGTLAATNGTLVISAASTKIKVYAFSLSTTSSTQVLAKFQSAVAGVDLWSVVMVTPAGGASGANLAVSPPAYLFASPTAAVLNLNLSSAQAVHWSVSYFMEA